MTAAELAMHDVQVIGIGTLAGLTLGYLLWRLPRHLHQINEWWIQRTLHRDDVEAEVARIHGGFSLEQTIPNQMTKPYWHERLADWVESRWDEFNQMTAPSSPEQVAKDCYLRELRGA